MKRSFLESPGIHILPAMDKKRKGLQFTGSFQLQTNTVIFTKSLLPKKSFLAPVCDVIYFFSPEEKTQPQRRDRAREKRAMGEDLPKAPSGGAGWLGYPRVEMLTIPISSMGLIYLPTHEWLIFMVKWIGEYTIYMDSIGIWMIGATRYFFWSDEPHPVLCFFPEIYGLTELV